MPTMIIERDGSNPVTVSLGSGTYSIGRNPENTIQIDQPTVSEFHCELKVFSNGRITVRDLNSETGTWINDTMVNEAAAGNADRVRIGDATVRFEGAIWHPIEPDGDSCPEGFSVPSQTPFLRRIPGAFAYACKGELGVLIVVLVLAGYIPYLLPGPLQLIGIVIGFAVGAIVLATWRDIIISTKQGSDTLGFRFNLRDWQEERAVILSCVFLAMICFGPAIVAQRFHLSRWLTVALFAGGALYFPMAFLVLNLTDSLDGLNPAFFVKSVARAPLDYAVTASIFAALVAVNSVLDIGRTQNAIPNEIQLALRAVLEMAGFYLAFVWVRILGLYYFCNRERLAWE